MTNIAEVIGWKFDHQPGMKTKDGIITEFPGGIPSQTDQDLWTAEYETSEDFKLKNFRQDPGYPVAQLILEALLEREAGSPGKLNGLVTAWNALKSKHGV